MYEDFWKLDRRPFAENASPDFHFASQSHEAALLKLCYLVEERKGLALLVGEHGMGKTHLTTVFGQELVQQGHGLLVRLSYPQLSPEQMLSYLACRLGSQIPQAGGEARVLVALEDRLREFASDGMHPVIVIDDAHLLEMEHLHQIRLLLNLRETGGADFSVLLCGRPELLARTKRLAALDQRTTLRAALAPLFVEEILPYIEHRMSVAGRQTPVFVPGAAATIWELSQGIPRRVNQLCDLALLVGFADTRQAIGSVEVTAAAEELVSVAA